MGKKKPRKESAVKKRTHIINQRTISQQKRRLATLEFDLLLPKDTHPEHPDWFRAFEALDHPNPISEQAEVIFKKTQALSHPRATVLDCARELRGALPPAVAAALRELEDAFAYVHGLKQILYFNLGVESGLKMEVVRNALNRSGIDVDKIESKSLLALSFTLAELAGRLSIKNGSDS